MSFIGNALSGIFGGDDSAEATMKASQTQAAAQERALDYLKETDQPLLDYRAQALPQLAGYFGIEIPGQESGMDQQAMLERVQLSPFYGFNLEQAEEAILRNQAATGGLRSGESQRALGESAMNLSQSLVDQQLRGLQQFAFPNLSTSQQAGIMQNIGATQAQGIVGAEQARQSAIGTGLNTILGGVGMFI